MGLKYNKIIQLMENSFHQNQMLNPEFAWQLNLIFQIEQILSKWKEILLKIIKKMKTRSQFHCDYEMWNKFQDDVIIYKKCFLQETDGLIRNIIEINFIDLDTKIKIKQNKRKYCMKFHKIISYMTQVMLAIKYPKGIYYLLTRKFTKIENNGNGSRIIWPDEDFDLQAQEEIKWQEEETIIKSQQTIDYTVNQSCARKLEENSNKQEMMIII